MAMNSYDAYEDAHICYYVENSFPANLLCIPKIPFWGIFWEAKSSMRLQGNKVKLAEKLDYSLIWAIVLPSMSSNDFENSHQTR